MHPCTDIHKRMQTLIQMYSHTMLTRYVISICFYPIDEELMVGWWCLAKFVFLQTSVTLGSFTHLTSPSTPSPPTYRHYRVVDGVSDFLFDARLAGAQAVERSHETSHHILHRANHEPDHHQAAGDKEESEHVDHLELYRVVGVPPCARKILRVV